MCGIVAYVGRKTCQPVLIEGLKRLEYRGYDSAGIAVIGDDKSITVRRAVGRISVLESKIQDTDPLPAATIGMAHTRWATHGAPTELNAHPHIANGVGGKPRIALVHNGIIENYTPLKAVLQERGYTFTSQTDTEVLAVLIGHVYRELKDKPAGEPAAKPGQSLLAKAVQNALVEVQGTYGIAVICQDEPDTLVVARKGSPLIIGVGSDEYIVASDAAAIVEHTAQVIYLNDNEMAVLKPQSMRTCTIDDIEISPAIQQLESKLEEYELGDYEHYMLKEIFEQPQAISNCLRGRADAREGRITLGGVTALGRDLAKTRRFILTGQGTAWHAGLIGDYLFEDLAKVVSEATYASEFRYRNPLVEEGTVLIAMSQSGETADTLAALREAREKGALALGVVNVVGSTIARETDAGVYLHAGPEIGVASTKAFTCQLCVLTMLAIYIGRRKFLSQPQCQELVAGLIAIPEQMRTVLKQNDKVAEIAKRFHQEENWLFLGRGYHYPVAL
ncbi:MAG TPA: glutamine--fructose-6-phosphate transaminase (isomerizing), partial [Tepidisphaeraceae bacterium]